MKTAFKTELLVLGIVLMSQAQAQGDSLMLADDLGTFSTLPEDDSQIISDYERLNRSLGHDSIRYCQGYACSGWVEDKYADGTLKHRGYYQDGQLLVYKNFHSNGAVEREFRTVDNFRGQLTTFHPNGAIRTEIKYFKGESLEWTDHYANGQVRYEEEKHKSEPWYLKMNLYQADGKPISTLMVVDKKKGEVEQKEYWPNGNLRISGRARFDANRRDCVRVGTWTSYGSNGKPVSEDRYLDGKIHETKKL
ncbi:MAG: hypothetical protein IPO17_05505 [Flavobacteriales bacterium]|nr:hypothetical protein [Flavobacteriales bacterium]MBK9194442.1 hypothetical protein [Flavobacteriales bacterium]